MPAPLSREFAFLAVLLAVGLWVGYAFAQETYLNHSLGQQAADLRQANATLATQNDGYRRDISASQAGAAAEEEARLNGYARPDERVYVVSRPAGQPSPAAPKVATRAGTSGPPAPSGEHGLMESFGRWIGNLWHR